LAKIARGGDDWIVEDIVCTSGPKDRPFEEQHSLVRIAIVVAGSFQYRTSAGHALMTPGSLLLGWPGQSYECAHEHAAGDRCLSFGYSPAYFERATGRELTRFHLPPARALSSVVARALAGVTSWEEIGVELALRAVDAVAGESHAASGSDVERVTRAVRAIERNLDEQHSLTDLARVADQSPFHFLRTFRRVTGVTPHQYVMRARLRDAARRLTAERCNVIDIAFGCGFGDVSNFNRAFRAEFGVSPRAYRAGS
jgi:AraC family transcriptional regulator